MKPSPVLALATFVVICGACRADDPPDDPRALLLRIERDRAAIRSGKLEIDLSLSHPQVSPGIVQRIRQLVEFEGENRRFIREERILTIPWLRSKAGTFGTDRAKVFDLIGSQDAVEKGQLGFWEETREVSIYAGKSFLSWTNDRAARVATREAAQVYGTQNYDPRTLGLTGVLIPRVTLSSLFEGHPGETLELVGREEIEGKPSLHLLARRSIKQLDSERHYWIEPPPGLRVYKVRSQSKIGRTETLNEYGPSVRGANLPSRTVSRTFRNGLLDMEMIIEIKSASFDLPRFDPETWSLTGLEMPPGVEVIESDARTARSVGFWDGVKLTREPVASRPVRLPRPKSSAVGLIDRIARRAPEHHVAMDAIVEALSMDASLIPICEPILRLILSKNPIPEDQAKACFLLAEYLKGVSERSGTGKAGEAAAVEAQHLFERIIKEFPDDKLLPLVPSSSTMGEFANVTLKQMRILGVGKAAPEEIGHDLKGKPITLREYRGQVVVVVCWASYCAPCLRHIPHGNELLAKMKGQSFAMLGLDRSLDREQSRKVAERLAITWPSCWKAGVPDPSTATGWDAAGLSDIYVLDPKGVIRFKNVFGPDLDRAVSELMDEMNGGVPKN